MSMKENFNKGLLLTSIGSFWWGFIGVLYFEYVSFIGHIELVVHRCLWTAIMLILTTTYFAKWKFFLFRILLSISLAIINKATTWSIFQIKFQSKLIKYSFFCITSKQTQNQDP